MFLRPAHLYAGNWGLGKGTTARADRVGEQDARRQERLLERREPEMPAARNAEMPAARNGCSAQMLDARTEKLESHVEDGKSGVAASAERMAGWVPGGPGLGCARAHPDRSAPISIPLIYLQLNMV